MNTLTVSGEAKELKNFVFASLGLPAQYPPVHLEDGTCLFKMRKETEPYFCFNALIPTPQQVLDIGFDGHAKYPAVNMMRTIVTGEEAVLDGYHWNILNWGTKWDVYYDKITPEEMGWHEGYTASGRSIHMKRVKRQMTLPRMEEILQSSKMSMLIGFGKNAKLYNLEYYLNRMYALNRDKMRCKVCGELIVDGDGFHAHHIRKNLPLSEVNRVNNLASTHGKCNKLIHGQISPDGFSTKAITNAERFRKKLLD